MENCWISARQAFDLIKRESGIYNAGIPICTRANVGLLKARARHVIIGEQPDERIDEVPLPARFWWAEGREALSQNWDQGDFETWQNSERFQAFGVMFDLAGLLEMVPAERRGMIAREMSVVGKPDWLSALAARRFIYEKAGHNPLVAADVLIQHCQLGFVTARAVQMQRGRGPKPNRWSIEEREWDIPASFWMTKGTVPGATYDWERGMFTTRVGRFDETIWTTLTGVHFYRPSLDVFLRIETASPPVLIAAAGGRPKAEYWDDLWCAIWGEIYRGKLIPKRQADVEKAMLDWLAGAGFGGAQPTIRPRARKLWAAYQQEDENSPAG